MLRDVKAMWDSMLATMLLLCVSACSSTSNTRADIRQSSLAWLPVTAASSLALPLVSGDRVALSVASAPELNSEREIDSEGNISFPFAPGIDASGRTISELESALRTALSDELRDPTLALSLTVSAERSITIGGDVETPGSYSWHAGLTMLQAILEAGGLQTTDTPRGITVFARRGVSGREFAEAVYRSPNTLDALRPALQQPMEPFDALYIASSADAHWSEIEALSQKHQRSNFEAKTIID